ncbi:MAG: ATP-binding protein [Eubacteriales bacterium]
MAGGNTKIAVLSGKGGTGKTTIAVNLSAVAGSVYADCDVEAPNGHLFLPPEPETITEEKITVLIPSVNHEKCSACRKCVDFCKFGGLAFAGGRVLVFENLCHSCGGCAIICEEGAISEHKKQIGFARTGKAGTVSFIGGSLNEGEATGVPVIQNIIEKAENKGGLVFFDSPPGSGCAVMEVVKACDYCLIVSEPTVFGLDNLKMIISLSNLLKKPFGVVINKALKSSGIIRDYLKSIGREPLLEIPYDSNAGKICSEGGLLAKEDAFYRSLFESLLEKIKITEGED